MSENTPAPERVGARRTETYNGVDRLNNALGYTIQNCVACCSPCNRAKGKMSPKEYLQLCLLVTQHWSEEVVPYVRRDLVHG